MKFTKRSRGGSVGIRERPGASQERPGASQGLPGAHQVPSRNNPGATPDTQPPGATPDPESCCFCSHADRTFSRPADQGQSCAHVVCGRVALAGYRQVLCGLPPYRSFPGASQEYPMSLPGAFLGLLRILLCFACVCMCAVFINIKEEFNLSVAIFGRSFRRHAEAQSWCGSFRV